MRTPQEVRLSGLIAYSVSLALGLVVAFVLHKILGSVGQLGFVALNPGGVLEFVVFALAFSSGLLLTREILKLPFSTLLTAGLIAPTTAARVAQSLPELENPNSLELETGTVILKHNGHPVALRDADRDRTLPWDEVPRVAGNVAVTELRGILSRSPFVIVADGDTVRGLITQEMFLGGLWRKPN